MRSAIRWFKCKLKPPKNYVVLIEQIAVNKFKEMNHFLKIFIFRKFKET